MKKYALSLLVLLLAGTAARAQQYEKNILGVRAGLNLAYIHATGDTAGNSSPRAGYYMGVSDQILLYRGFPLYLETGVVFSSRGGRFDGISLRPMYMQVPLLVNYRIRLGRHVSIRPYAGIYYGVGIGGKARHDEGWTDLFGSYGILRRSDLGARMGIGIELKRIWFGAGFDLGCLNDLAPGNGGWLNPGDNRYSYNFTGLRSHSFTLGIGYNF